MNEEIDDLNSSLREIRLENEEEIEFLRSKVVSRAKVNKSWFDFRSNVCMTFPGYSHLLFCIHVWHVIRY